MAMRGKTIQLRASCNACNESKVRCSQHKPTCARCERNGNQCIYGLSRRTHKDAPPISTPSATSQRSRGPLRSFSKSNTGTYDATLLGDYMSPAGSHFVTAPQQQNNAIPAAIADLEHDARLPLLDFSSLSEVTGTGTGTETSSSSSSARLNDSLSQVTTPFPSLCAENTEYWPSNKAMLWAQQTAMVAPVIGSPLLASGRCTCHTGVTDLLASMSCGGNEQRLSLDARLAKLKRCIVSSETSLGCAHDHEDAEPIHIMAVATLIGYVINDFEMLANESLQRRSPSSAVIAAAHDVIASQNTKKLSSHSLGSDQSMSGMVDKSANMSPGELLEPRLSWGVLELEEDEEVDFRRMVYLLSFRKLERLLSQLMLYLRNLRDARATLLDPVRHMGFVTACDYTCLWLERRVEEVKELFSVVNPALTHHMKL